MNLENFGIPHSEEVDLNDYQPIPVGWYPAQVEKEETVQTSKGGTMLKYTLSIFGDKCRGRKVFPSFNLVCPSSESAEKIGRKQLAQFGKACHLVNLTDSTQLLGKTCKVKVDQDEYDGKVRNKVTGFDYLDPEVVSPVAETKEADVPFWMK